MLVTTLGFYRNEDRRQGAKEMCVLISYWSIVIVRGWVHF